MNFFKTKKLYILLAVVVVGGLIVYGQVKKANKPTEYETVKVQRGDLQQTVEATGKVESQSDLSLRFEVPGAVASINTAVGATVKTGDVLASLRLSELNAAVAQAQANLNQRVAGATQAERDYYKAVVDQASADLEKTKSDTNNQIAAAEAAVRTAENNLKLVENGNNSQIVASAYEDAVAVLQTSLVKLDDGLVQADAILGIDNTSINDEFQSQLSVSNPNKLNEANSQYNLTKNLISQARVAISPLSNNSAGTSVDTALTSVLTAYVEMNRLLVVVGDVLNASLSGSNFSQSALTAKKTSIDVARTSVNAQYAIVVNTKQSISDAKNSYTTYSIAFVKATQDLEDIKNSVAATLKIKDAMYKQALANYQNKINPVRDVDVASYRAALSQAVANRNKAVIRAPIDGVVTSINKKIGEFTGSSEEMIRMFVPHYEVQVDIPETDISKLKVGDSVGITLDAFGEDVAFSGTVVNMEPGSTNISDVVYYKVTITINDSEKDIKPGMTANVSISTDFRAGALFVPLRSVQTKDDGKYVRVLQNNQSVDTKVVLGIRADDGRVEIIEGVTEGQEIILNVKE
jgi:RND family efflux transporter MFP subunit